MIEYLNHQLTLLGQKIADHRVNGNWNETNRLLLELKRVQDKISDINYVKTMGNSKYNQV